LRILISGADGFTGKYFVKKALENKHEVISLKSDLLEDEELKNEILSVKPEAVVHLAAISFVGHENINDFYNVNVIGTLNLLKSISKLSVLPKSILLASSANVYGNSDKSPITENQSFNPLNDYAVSKVAMEYVAKLWMEKLPILIVRPFNYTGVGQNESFLIPKIVSHFVKRAKLIELGNLDVAREFLDVRDVVQIYLQLIELSIKNEIVNICSGIPHQLKDVISMAEEITNHKIQVKINPLFVRENELKVLKGDDGKLRNICEGIVKTPFKDTLKWMIAGDNP
jgi:GDP-6-deoxy-D-talose 4-dehydrogenase